MPFLRSELNLNYTLGGLHLTAFSASMVLTGLFGRHLTRPWGRGPILWGGAAGTALGGILLAAAHHVALILMLTLRRAASSPYSIQGDHS